PPDRPSPPPIRTIYNRCRDGSPRCDTDHACDGSCTFVTCADPNCGTTLPIVVPLRRGGRAPGKFVLPPSAGTRLVLLCLPRRGPCPVTPTTTLPCPYHPGKGKASPEALLREVGRHARLSGASSENTLREQGLRAIVVRL